ncbi:MAG: urea ABC transporter permease subunit UrtC [Lachnospiraceae bacterium]
MKLIRDNRKNLFFIVIVVVLALMPLLMSNDLIKSTTVQFLGKCIAFSIIAIALDLIWGHTGILSLGHGLYFCLGGYAMAMYLKLQATGGAITDFMKTGGLTDLPLIWRPFESAVGMAVMLVVVPVILSGLLGYFIFKNRVKGVYFSIISQALTWAAYSIFIAMSPYTNGNVGITEITPIVGSIRGERNMGNLILLFYIALAVLAVVYIIAALLVKSKFGKVLIAIRDGENRTYFSGYNVSLYKTAVYVLSALLAAVAGAIFVNFNGSITPSQMTISYSITMVIWVALGGRGTLVGAILGAFLVNLCEYNMSSGSLVEIWQYIIGGLFVVTILFFKDGIMGIVTKQIPALVRRLRDHRKGEEMT